MVDIGILMEDLAAGSVPADEGMRLLEEIESRPSRFGLVALAAALGLVGAGVAVMFSTQWIDVGLGFLAGVLAFTMILTSMRWSWLGRSLDFSTGLVMSFLATWLATAITGSNPFVITMCAVAVYIPGFLLSQGLTEMFMGNPLSGIGRIVGATMVTVRLFAGALIGTALAYLIWGGESPAPESIDVPLVVLFGFIGVLMVGVAVFFQARVHEEIESSRKEMSAPQLNDRELEVLMQIALGATRNEVAAQLCLSTNTIKTYLRRTYLKLGVGTRDAAISRAQALGLLDETRGPATSRRN